MGQEQSGFAGRTGTASSLDELGTLIDWNAVGVLLDPLFMRLPIGEDRRCHGFAVAAFWSGFSIPVHTKICEANSDIDLVGIVNSLQSSMSLFGSECFEYSA